MHPDTEQRPGRSIHNGRHTQEAMHLVAKKMIAVIQKSEGQNWSQAQN